MGKIWVTSDTHFGHENIIQYCNRPFKNAWRMTNQMKEMWNDTVGEYDKVYHLGDVYFGNGWGQEFWMEFFPSLHGKKRLILGNHDDGKDPVLLKNFEKILVWRAFGDLGLLLTHVPVHPSTLGENPRRPTGWLNVHGHTHEKGEPEEHKEKYKCVCVEHTDYKPILLDELIKIAEERRASEGQYRKERELQTEAS